MANKLKALRKRVAKLEKSLKFLEKLFGKLRGAGEKRAAKGGKKKAAKKVPKKKTVAKKVVKRKALPRVVHTSSAAVDSEEGVVTATGEGGL